MYEFVFNLLNIFKDLPHTITRKTKQTKCNEKKKVILKHYVNILLRGCVINVYCFDGYTSL